jgi:glycerophosphoryl diester phosphodiesterase
MVNVVAHRGYSGKYPENTEIAFREALALQVDTIEFDVCLSRDEALIVIHDPTVDRTSDGSGEICRMTLSEIKALDAGSWFDEAFGGQRFLTLQETLDMMDEPVRLNVHIKPGEHDLHNVVSLTIQELERQNLLQQAFIASDHETIEQVKRIQPALELCNLSTEPKETYIARSRAIGCRILQPGNAQVDRAFVEEAHRYGMEVNPFYADEVDEMRRLMACGVDGILTNYPDRLLALRKDL